MLKKLMIVFLCLAFCLSMTACGQETNVSTESTDSVKIVYEEVPLTEDEKMILEAMGSDVNVISDKEYVHSVAELIYHTHDYIGQVYQLEGIFSSNGENLSVYRTLVNGSETQTLGLPLRYLEKEIVSGAWVRVTGVVAESNENGEHITVLDIVAIEALTEYGQTELEWDGSSVHQH